jgi:hypothetical protein
MPYKNIIKRLEYSRIYYLNHKESRKIKDRIYNLKNKERIAEKARELYLKNFESITKYKHEWYLKNKLRILIKRKIYESQHKKEINEYNRNKRKINVNFKISHNLRNRILKVLKGTNKSKSTLKLLGCSIEQLKKHLEKQFTEGMSFSNYGKWHIDHIRPCSSYDLSKTEEQALCFHYTNLQPLWALDNICKGAKTDV